MKCFLNNFRINKLLCLLFYSGVISLSGCGIAGTPLSPSQIVPDKEKSLLPFNTDNADSSRENSADKHKNYVEILELQNIGNDYNTNIGIENNDLQDVFERLKPASALPRKKNILPLQR